MNLDPAARPNRAIKWLGFGLIFLGTLANLPRAPQSDDGRACATCCVLGMETALAEDSSGDPGTTRSSPTPPTHCLTGGAAAGEAESH